MKTVFFTLISCFFLIDPSIAQSPLRVRTDLPPVFLVKNVLLGKENGFEISNIKYIGNYASLGGFSNSSKYYLIKKGIILSTGNAKDAIGPNQSPDRGSNLKGSGNYMLDKIASGKTYDACELSFEFSTTFDSLSFNFIFASEEYPEYVHQGVNDIFAFFIEDLSTHEIRNMAVISKKSEAVNVDNVNAIKNREFYIENGIWEAGNVLKWKDDPGLGELALTYEFDGFTTLLTTGCSLKADRKYRITFVIADVGDGLYDSAVFLDASSFKTFKSSSKRSPPFDIQKIKNEFIDNSVSWRANANSLTLLMPVNFGFDDDQVRADSSLKILLKVARLLKLNESIRVSISGHTDNVGETSYNVDLSERRADFVFNYLISSGVSSKRMTKSGFGDQQPVSDNVTKRGRLKNRRIEFDFY